MATFNVAASIKMRKCGVRPSAHLAFEAPFNVAASIKMRKWNGNDLDASGYFDLQCGRIYKDAEIDETNDSAEARVLLQCGRIYKDAEIRWAGRENEGAHRDLQCGRIYKDAEMRQWRAMQMGRKRPSMWPHL